VPHAVFFVGTQNPFELYNAELVINNYLKEA